MAIHESKQLRPETHSVKHLFTDDFGHQHEVIYPTHIAKDGEQPWPAGEASLEPFDAEPQLANVRKLMAEREQGFLEHCLSKPELARHPKVLSHPDHPSNKSKPQDVSGYQGCCGEGT